METHTQQQNEVWRAVVGYEGAYEVSNLGRVRSLRRKIKNRRGVVPGKVLTPRISSNGYQRVSFSHRGIDQPIHRLVLTAFIGLPNKIQRITNHKDGNKLNNRLENLEWCTYKENRQHAVGKGLIKSNRGQKWVHLSAANVIKIRNMYGKVNSHILAKKFNVSQTTISRVGLRQTFKNI